MNIYDQPRRGPGLYDRLTQWRGPVIFVCLAVAVLAFLWAVPGGLFRSAAASSRTTTPHTKPIEQIIPGDLVLARDPESGETRAKQVLRVFRNVSDHLRLLTVRNADGTSQVLRTTDGHPFWVPDRGWTAAAELKVGDNLVQADGQPATLVATAYEAHPEGVPIFNFEVEGFHTYFVAANSTRAPPILVHNTSPSSSGPSTSGAGRSFRDRIADFQRDPSRWERVSAHTEAATRRGARQGGVSTQTLWRNRDTGETLWQHTVTNNRGRVVDDHFRPNFKPRAGDLNEP